MISESGKWSFDSGLTPSYSSNGMFLGNVSSGKTAKFNGSYNFPLTVDFDVVSIITGSSNSIAFEFKQTHNDYNALFISTGLGIVLNGDTFNTGISQSSYTGHYQLKFTSVTNCELYKDNTLITSVNNISVPNLQFMVWLSVSRSVTIKNIKIKPL